VAVRDGIAGSTSQITLRELRETLDHALAGSAPQTAQILIETGRIRHHEMDDTIFFQGAEIPLTLIVRGYGAYRRTTDDGRQVTVGIASPGELFGFTSLTAALASADLVALGACDVVTWRGPDLRRMAAADPGFALDAIDRMAMSLTSITEKVDGFLHQDSRRRVLRVLGRHRELFFRDPPVLLRSHLPSLVGTTREMTGRVLRDLERDGTVLRVGRTGLRLLRPDRLEAEATRPPSSVKRPPAPVRRR
jgi:CRP-like cAMP-binding protein